MKGKRKESARDGAGEEVSAVSKQAIMTLLAGKARELADIRTTATKYPTLRRIISTTAGELPADTRLPGIRDLAICLGSSLVTTQKAVSELTSEGVLYSKPRAGVFVSSRDEASGPFAHPFTGSASSSEGHPFHAGFDFGTDSAAPHQQKFWEEVAELFRQHHPNASPTLRFVPDPAAAVPPPDVYECYNWKRYWEKGKQKDSDGILDIGGFGAGMLPIPPTREGRLPLYHRTYFLFFNPDLLDHHGLPAPDYRSFAGQSEYLRTLAPGLAACGLESRPYSIQEPVTLIGGCITDFFKLFDAKNKNPQPGSRLLKATEDLIAFNRLCRRSFRAGNDWSTARNAFLKGQSPFFMGYSVDYWDFSQRKLPFALGVYPTLCCDDTFFLWLRVGAIAHHSEHPVESLNFLTFLLRDDIQKRFTAGGNFGANLTETDHPAMAADSDWVASTLAKSVPFELGTKENYYMVINVLGGEIWRSLQEDISAAEVLNRAVQLGRFYQQRRAT